MLTYQLHSDHWRCTILLQKVYRRSKWVIVAIVQPSTTSHTDIHRLSTFRDPKTAIFVCIPQSYRYMWWLSNTVICFFKSRNTRSSTVHFPSHSRKWPNWGHRHFWCCVPCFVIKYWKPKSMLYGHTASSHPQSTTSSTRSKTSSASRASAFSRKSDHQGDTTS